MNTYWNCQTTPRKAVSQNYGEVGGERYIMIDAKLNIVERVNKKGESYNVLELHVFSKLTGELLHVHDIYMRESLKNIIEYTQKEKKDWHTIQFDI